jgi:hypothetical protein
MYSPGSSGFILSSTYTSIETAHTVQPGSAGFVLSDVVEPVLEVRKYAAEERREGNSTSTQIFLPPCCGSSLYLQL